MDTITTGRAATVLGVNVNTVNRYVDDGVLVGFRLPSGHRRVMVASVDALAKSFKTQQATPVPEWKYPYDCKRKHKHESD